MSETNAPSGGNPASMRETAAELRAQAAQMMADASRLDREVAQAELERREALKPKMPEVAEAAPVVVAFSKYQSGREYNYAAVGWRVGRQVRWTTTGQGGDRLNWPGLLQFIGEANWPSLRVMNDGDSLLPEGAEPPVVERMGSYGRVLGSSVVDPLVRAEVPGYGRGRFARGGMVGPYEG